MTSSRQLSFGDLLKRCRVAAGLTQEELAARAGLSPKGISDLERGARQTPRRDTMQLLAEALKLSDREYAVLEAAARRRGTGGSSSEGSSPAMAGESTHRTLPPLVGRGQEQALIERHLTGDGPEVLVFAGEPGIGKSRLLREAALLGQEQGWRVLQGGCHRRSGQEPFAPFLALLERHLASLSPAERRVALKGCGWLARLLPELAEEVPEMTHGWSLPPEQERRLMFGAVARYLANVVGAAGILLVIDDLQWAGADALDLLEFVIRAPSPRPLRVVAAYRDIEVRSQDALAVLLTDLAREGHVLRSALHPLLTPEAATLLDELLSGLPGDQVSLRQQVLQRAGGLPFFLVSCAQALRDGVLKGEQAHLEGATLPWSVTESIRQRIAALPELAQETLGVAAVIGRVVPRPLLVRVAGEPARREEEILTALEAACQSRLLMEEGETAYIFAHDLVREVVGSDLSAARRARLHRQVAQALEQGQSETSVEVLAYHYSLAGEREQAIKYLERAGEHALGVHANSEAARYYREVVRRLEEAGQMMEAAQARERLGTALILLAHYDEAVDVLEKAIEMYRRENLREQWLRTLAQVGWVQALRGTPSEGLERLEPLRESLRNDPPSSGLAAFYVSLAQLYFIKGQFTEQLAAAERGVELARASRDQRLLVTAQDRLAAGLMPWNRLEEARQILTEEVIPQAEALGDLQIQVRAWLNLGELNNTLGCLDQDRYCSERALAIAEQMGEATYTSIAHFFLGWHSFDTGDWKQARKEYEQALSLIRPVAMSRNAVFPSLGLGTLCLAEGQQEAAVRYLEEAVQLGQQARDPGVQGTAHAALAERELLEGQSAAALARLRAFLQQTDHQTDLTLPLLPLLAWAQAEQGEVSQAQELLTRLIEQRRGAQLRLGLALALRTQSLLAVRQARWQEAGEALEEALALCRAIGNPYAEAKMLYTYGVMHLQQGEPALARKRLEEALAILRRLGERLYAHQAEQALRRSSKD